MRKNRRYIACNILFMRTDADNKRTVAACAEQLSGFVCAQYTQSIAAFEHALHIVQRLPHISFIKSGEQMGYDLGICFGNESDTLLLQHFTQAAMVFNNTVVYDNDSAGCILMGMRISVTRCTVRCPARMADAADSRQYTHQAFHTVLTAVRQICGW